MPDIKQLEINGTVYDVRDPTKAPAGYGLGTNAKVITNCNTVWETGFYRWDTLAEGAPFPYAVMQAIGRSGGSCTQIVYGAASANADVVAKRRGNATSGEWQEWDYMNPPLSPGVEYRTTERWNGKAVYTKAIAFGSLPNATSASINHDIALSAVLDARGTDSNGANIPRSVCTIDAGSGTVKITTTSDLSARTAIIALKYTKD